MGPRLAPRKRDGVFVGHLSCPCFNGAARGGMRRPACAVAPRRRQQRVTSGPPIPAPPGPPCPVRPGSASASRPCTASLLPVPRQIPAFQACSCRRPCRAIPAVPRGRSRVVRTGAPAGSTQRHAGEPCPFPVAKKRASCLVPHGLVRPFRAQQAGTTAAPIANGQNSPRMTLTRLSPSGPRHCLRRILAADSSPDAVRPTARRHALRPLQSLQLHLPSSAPSRYAIPRPPMAKSPSTSTSITCLSHSFSLRSRAFSSSMSPRDAWRATPQHGVTTYRIRSRVPPHLSQPLFRPCPPRPLPFRPCPGTCSLPRRLRAFRRPASARAAAWSPPLPSRLGALRPRSAPARLPHAARCLRDTARAIAPSRISPAATITPFSRLKPHDMNHNS